MAWGGGAIGNWGSGRELLGWTDPRVVGNGRQQLPDVLLGSQGQECVVRMKPEEESEKREDENWAEAREGEERGSL